MSESIADLTIMIERLDEKRRRMDVAFASYKEKERVADMAFEEYLKASDEQNAAWKRWEAIAHEAP